MIGGVGGIEKRFRPIHEPVELVFAKKSYGRAGVLWDRGLRGVGVGYPTEKIGDADIVALGCGDCTLQD